jgi:hypothetical protein
MEGGAWMENLRKRIERVEQECGMDKADEPTTEILVGNSTLRMTGRQLTGLLQWVQERNEVRGGAYDGLTDAAR